MEQNYGGQTGSKTQPEPNQPTHLLSTLIPAAGQPHPQISSKQWGPEERRHWDTMRMQTDLETNRRATTIFSPRPLFEASFCGAGKGGDPFPSFPSFSLPFIYLRCRDFFYLSSSFLVRVTLSGIVKPVTFWYKMSMCTKYLLIACGHGKRCGSIVETQPRSGSPYAGLGAFPVGKKGSITKEKVWEPFGGKPVGIFVEQQRKILRTNDLIVANDTASTQREMIELSQDETSLSLF